MLVLPDAATTIELFPVPVLGFKEIQAGEVALQEQLGEDATMPMEEFPPLEPNDRLAGFTVKLQGWPDWLTGSVWPAMLIVPLSA